MSNTEVFLSLDDYRKEAMRLNGSRDFGAQLFCALLRSAAVEARLVCSLQPLPFSNKMESTPPQKHKSYHAIVSSEAIDISSDDSAKSGNSGSSSSRGPRRLGQPQFAPSKPARPTSYLGK